MISGSLSYTFGAVKEVKSAKEIISYSPGWIRVKFFVGDWMG